MIEELTHADSAAAHRMLHLLPGAPRELVDDAYLALRNRRLARANGADPTLDDDLEQLTHARDAVLANGDGPAVRNGAVDHSPWALLHVAKDAPPEIVELAYRVRRNERAVEPIETSGNGATEPGPPLLGLAVPTTTPSPSAAPARLVAEAGTAHPARSAIGESPLRIGGDPTCDIVVGVTGNRRGRTEARLWRRQGRVMFHGVAGLTSVNGHAVGWAVLEAGDTVQVGETVFRVEG
jgi:hypothetical protein